MRWLPGAMLILLSANLQAQTADPPRIDSIHDAMQGFVDDHKLSGAVSYVWADGKLRHLDAVGWADIEQNRPMRNNSLFCIASMTKPISASAVMILCDDRKLSLEDRVAQYIPEFDEGNRSEITLRQLLSHTSGLSGSQINEGTLAENARAVAKRPLAFPPGTSWGYSPGLSVAGRVVEVASGMSFDAFLESRIFQPLGMKDSTFYPSDEDSSRLAVIYGKGNDDSELTPATNVLIGPAENRSPNPSAGLFSTASDLGRFYQMLLNRGEWDGTRILSEDAVREMTRVQSSDYPAGFTPGSAYGLGLGLVREPTGVTEMFKPGTFGHGGLYGTQAWVDPEQQLVCILMIQRVGLINADASIYRRTLQELAVKALGE